MAALLPGFNLVTWTGPDATPVADAVAGLGDALDAVFAWDQAAQAFLRYGPTAPAFLNTLDTLDYGQGIWVLVNRAVDWAQPAR